MAIVGLLVLIGCVVLCFASMIFWALVLQPRTERALAQLSPNKAWSISGFEQIRAEGYSLYQIVPSERIGASEFSIQDENQLEIGRYIGNINKSGTLEYAGKKVGLYIQGGLFGGSTYSGKVGGTSDKSIVIRDDARLIAEIWRDNAIPPINYRVAYSGDTFYLTTGGILPTSTGAVTHNGRQIGVFRRAAVSARNLFAGFSSGLPEELKMCLSMIAFLK